MASTIRGSDNFDSGITSKPLGVGQTWQDVKASRAVGVTYTNTTGRPIVVSASCATNAVAFIRMVVDGVVVSGEYQSTISAETFIAAIVPAGSTYEVQVTGGTPAVPYTWSELR